MPSTETDMLVHKLHINPNYKPVQQNKRVFNLKKYEAIKQEVEKLKIARFIKEVVYPTWLENVVLIKNANWQWCKFQGSEQSVPEGHLPSSTN